jgi:protein TonB
VQNGDTSIPSGLPEPPSVAAWNRDAIRRMLLAARPEGDHHGSGDFSSAEPLPPTEAELLTQDAVHTLTSDIEAPVRIRKVDPIYPEKARKARVQGRVVLQAMLDTDGNLVDLSVVKGNPMLDPAALSAACCWKYRPARWGGVPVPIYFTLQIDFTLK